MGLAATSSRIKNLSFSSRSADLFLEDRARLLSETAERFFTRGQNLVCTRHRQQISNVSARFTVKYRLLSPYDKILRNGHAFLNVLSHRGRETNVERFRWR